MEEPKSELMKTVYKLLPVVGTAIGGWLTQLSWKLVRGQKIKLWQSIGAFGLCLAVGLAAGNLCEFFGAPKFAIAAAAAGSVLSNNIMTWIMTRDWTVAFEQTMSWLINKK